MTIPVGPFMAGWVAFNRGDGGGTNAEMAARWLTTGERSRLRTLLVAPHKSLWHGGPDIIQAWAAKNGVTPRSSKPPRSEDYAVLCYAPDFKTLSLAQQYARDGAIAVVEWPSDPMIGWAMEVGATNLRIGETAPSFDADIRAVLDLVSHVGNNGWASGMGRNTALSALESYGFVEPNLVAGSMLARGHSPESVAWLQNELRKRQG